jgi:ferredoxin--NADP+ reductase
MAKPLEYNATLARRVDLTDSLTIFTVKPDAPLAGSGRWFVPGQYVAIGMNNEAQPALGSVRRAMSIASAPQTRDEVEFYIRFVSHPESDNPLTHLLWKGKEGDRMFLRPAPTGKFTIEDTVGAGDRRKKVYVAAGTGLAPFLCIARAAIIDDPDVDLSEHVILHGASYPADLGYREELEAMVERNRLHYYTTVSRPKEAAGWTGDAGRVEDYFKAERLGELEQRLGLGAGEFTPANAAVLVCGLQGTISESITRLLGRGFVPDNRKIRKALAVPEDVKPTLFFEQYDNTPVIDLDDTELVTRLGTQLRTALEA